MISKEVLGVRILGLLFLVSKTWLKACLRLYVSVIASILFVSHADEHGLNYAGCLCKMHGNTFSCQQGLLEGH